MRPNVKGRKNERIMSIAFVLQKVLACIRKAGFPAPSEKNVRDLLHKVVAASTEYKSAFLDQPKKISCVRIPRDVLSKDTLEQIDKRMFNISILNTQI